MKDQSIGGKLVDVAFIGAIAFLCWSGKISEVSSVLLLAAIAQARGAVGAVSKISSALGVGSGPPSDRPPGGPGSGSSGSMRTPYRGEVQLPPVTPERKPETFVKRMAVGAVHEESTVGWGLAAFALSVVGAVGSVARMRHAPLVLGVLVVAIGCVR